MILLIFTVWFIFAIVFVINSEIDVDQMRENDEIGKMFLICFLCLPLVIITAAISVFHLILNSIRK